MSEKITQLSNGVQGVFIKNNRFNTTLISFNFYMPLSYENAANYALVPFVLTTCSKKYPDFSRLNYKLSKLYGANLSASSEKVGDFQLLKIAISVIDDRFTLDNETLCDSAVDLLTQLIFEPKVQDGSFFEDDIEREKRKAIEHVRSELSEKRVYAKNRMISEMYSGEAYGVQKCGSEEDIAKINGKSLYRAWCEVLSRAFIRVNVISRNLPSGLFDGIKQKFDGIVRKDICDCTKSLPTKKANKINTVTERMNIAQGNLVMGFSSELFGNCDEANALTVMCDIFGGGPYSRLFSNVREKLSLCYYCSASSVKSKGLITVSSGIEAGNAKRAQDEILNQLDVMKLGRFSDFEFESSIKSITDSLNSYNDSQGLLDVWYSLKISNNRLITPEDAVNMISKVTKKDVIDAANGVFLHTVYRLLPEECDNV